MINSINSGLLTYTDTTDSRWTEGTKFKDNSSLTKEIILYSVGQGVMHTSWLTAVFRRMLMHESIYVVRWAANTILTLNLNLCPMLEQGQGKVKLVTFLVKK